MTHPRIDAPLTRTIPTHPSQFFEAMAEADARISEALDALAERDKDAAELERLRDENADLNIRADELWSDLMDTRADRDRARARVRQLETALATVVSERDTAVAVGNWGSSK